MGIRKGKLIQISIIWSNHVSQGTQPLATLKETYSYMIQKLVKKSLKYRHINIINAIDDIGKAGSEYGTDQIVSESRDGAIKVWDPRQDTPLEPAESEKVLPDCWYVRYTYNIELWDCI